MTDERGAQSARRRPLPRQERYLYTYRLLAGNTPLQFMISYVRLSNTGEFVSDLLRVEPESGKPRHGKYTFNLSFKANGVERPLCEPTVRTLKVDPRQLDFAVLCVVNASLLIAV